MYTRTQTRTERVLQDVLEERRRQTEKHGVQTHLPDGTGPDVWLHPDVRSARTFGELAQNARLRCKAASENEGGDGSIAFEHILTEEWAEALAESDPAALRGELVQLAAVAVQWCEKLDREAER